MFQQNFHRDRNHGQLWAPRNNQGPNEPKTKKNNNKKKKNAKKPQKEAGEVKADEDSVEVKDETSEEVSSPPVEAAN